MADEYLSNVKIGTKEYKLRASALSDELYKELKQSVMTYKGSATWAELQAMEKATPLPNNGDVYTISDQENREVVWYMADGGTPSDDCWIDLGYDDHAHAVEINGTKKTFTDSSGEIEFTLSGDGTGEQVPVLSSVIQKGYITDPGHTHSFTGTLSPTYTSTSATITQDTTGKGDYTPSGTIEPFNIYRYTLTGASYTPQGSVTMPQQAITPSNRASGDTSTVGYTPQGTVSGTAVSIPVNTYVEAVGYTPDGIKSASLNYGTGWNDFVVGLTSTRKQVSVSVPAQTYLTGMVMNSTAKDIAFTGSAGTATATYTPAGTINKSSKTIVHYDSTSETLVFDNTSVNEPSSFSGTKATISSSYTPSGKATIPANTYYNNVQTNTATTLTSSQYFVNDVTTNKFDISTADTDTLIALNTEKATNTLFVAKNTSPKLLNVTDPTFTGQEKILYYIGGTGTFTGTKTTITPKLNETSSKVGLTFAGDPVYIEYDKATSIDYTSFSIGKSSTGITHYATSFREDAVTDIDTITITAR